MNKYTLELNISSEDISHNPNFKFEEKLQMLKGILDEYDEIKTTSNWEIIDKENVAMNLSTPLEINVKLTADSSSFVINEALRTLYEKRTEPKDELLAILKDIVGKLSASGEKVGELGGADVVSGGLMQEDVDYHTENINSRIKELEG